MRSKDSLLLAEAYSLIIESQLSIEQFRNQLFGAFQIVFDADKEQVGNSEIHRPFSAEIGMRDYNISYDFRVPVNASTALSLYFPIEYKLQRYIVDCRAVVWNKEPDEKDFMGFANGQGLQRGGVVKVPIDTDKPLTALGDVSSVEYLDGEDQEIDIGSIGVPQDGFKHYRINDLGEFARHVKSIIDGYENRRKERVKRPAPSPTSNKPERDLVAA